jgi:hypothetical protein
VTPAISAFCLAVFRQIKHLNLTFPNGLTPKHLMHGHCFAVNCSAPVQLLNRYSQAVQIILSIRHSVRPFQAPPIDSFQFLRLVPVSP